MKQRSKAAALLLAALLLLTACAAPEREPAEEPMEKPIAEPAEEPVEEPTEEPVEEPIEEPTEESTEEPMETPKLKLEIGDAMLTAEFADTQAAQALREELEQGSVTVSVSNYGGWEKVGELPWELPASDVQTDAAPGDIMLYRGNSIVLFYGSNSWAYTRLGTIVDNSADSLEAALSGEETELVLSLIWEET